MRSTHPRIKAYSRNKGLGVGVKVVEVSQIFVTNGSFRIVFTKPLECLKLTKAMQKTAESLQSVADLYDDHVRIFSVVYR